jgi:hypothetical protein
MNPGGWFATRKLLQRLRQVLINAALTEKWVLDLARTTLPLSTRLPWNLDTDSETSKTSH